MLWKRCDETGKPFSFFIIKGPRGGGKTKLLGAFGFADWYIGDRDIVNMGGSMTQAQGVYNYFSEHCYAQPAILESLPQEPKMKETESDTGKYYKAVAASPKQVRGPHPNTLAIDEACEAKDELIEAALPMIFSSNDPLVVMTSTFHKIFGKFQEVWDAADELNYARFSWDIIDVTKTFDPSIWTDEAAKREIHDLTIEQAGENSLEYRVGGRTGDPEGWVPMSNVVQAWRSKSSIDWFDVEMMGMRPSSVGMVNKPEDVDACVFECNVKGPWPKEYRYIDGLESVGGVDWGFSSMTAVVGFHKGRDDLKMQHHNKTYTATRSKVIIEDIVECVRKYKWRTVYCDSAGKFENADLKAALQTEFGNTKHRCNVVEVVFSVDKVEMLGNYRSYFQRRMLRIPDLSTFKAAVWQHKRYRYQEGSDKPMKQDDHIPDATMCALKHWPLGRNASEMPKQNVNQNHGKKKSTITGGLMDMNF